MRISNTNDVLIYFKNLSCFKEIHSTIHSRKHHTGRRGDHKIILEDSERNCGRRMPLACDLLVTFSSGSEARLLFPRTECHNINVSALHAKVLVAWRTGGHILRSGLTI